MKSCMATFLAGMAFLFLSKSSVSSFLVSKRTLAPKSTLFRERKGDTIYPRVYAESTKESWVVLRGGSEASADNRMAGTEAEESTKQVVAEVSSSTPVSEAYYLVWSPGFVKKLALATAILALIRRTGWDHRFFGFISGSIRSMLPAAASPASGGLFSNVVLPLLSSSCCAIQLAVNTFSALLGAGAGCVGFNTVLGPLRPFLLAVMLAYYTVPTTSATLVRFAIALMPEVVFGWNDLLRTRWKRKMGGSERTGGGIQATLTVEVPTMGCVACVNKIESSLRTCAPDNIESASSWLNPKDESAAAAGKKKGGRAQIKIRASSTEELDDLARRFVGAIEDAGFKESTIQSLKVDSEN